MGTAWPQKYHSSRGHASAAATVLAQNKKTAPSPASRIPATAPPTLTLTPQTPPESFATVRHCRHRRRHDDSWFQRPTPDAVSAPTTDPSVGPAAGRARQRQRFGVGNERSPAAAVPVAAGLPLSAAHWRPTGNEADDDRGSIKATPGIGTASSRDTVTTTTTTTMNASNHVTLNRFVRLTITLLITRTLMLRLVQLQLLIASVVVLAANATFDDDDADDTKRREKPPHQQPKQQQPNAAIQTTNNNCTVRTKTKGMGQQPQQRRRRQLRQPASDGCWPPSLYCYPVAIFRNVTVTVRHNRKRQLLLQSELTAGEAAMIGEEVQAGSQPAAAAHEWPGCSGWCGCSCQRCSLLTCSRFFMESVTKRSCPGPADRPTAPSARRCSATRRTTRASVCTSS